MKYCKLFFSMCLVLLLFTDCRYYYYSPRSKRNIYRERPSVMLLDKIVNFRVEQSGWPTSKEDFMSRGKKYVTAFQGFRYSYTFFRRIDSNKMIFYFSGHIKDASNYLKTGKTDLNSYRGSVTFYKENHKFLWKLKMR